MSLLSRDRASAATEIYDIAYFKSELLESFFLLLTFRVNDSRVAQGRSMFPKSL